MGTRGESARPRLTAGGRAGLIGVVLICLGLSVAATWGAHEVVKRNLRDRLAFESSQVDVAIVQRMQAYVQILRGGAAFFAGSNGVSRDEWVAYVDALDLGDRYPGFKSLSFAPAVADADLDAFVAGVRASEVPDGMEDPALISHYTVRSPTGVPGETALHSPILYVAPFSPENQMVLGVDMMQDPMRRAVMEEARRLGEAQVSPRLRLAGQIDDRPGFIAYFPVTEHGEFAGWLSAAFRAPDFMVGLRGEFASHLQFEVTDGDGALLWSSRPPKADGTPVPLGAASSLQRSGSVELPGQTWVARYAAGPGFATPVEALTPWIVGAGGLVLTMLVLAVGLSGGGWRRLALHYDAQHSELVASAAVIRYQASHDSLTGVANRKEFRERLDEAIEAGEVGLVYVDVDGFKSVNDTFGHRAGDALLVVLASRLTQAAGPRDTVARLGGDEFAVIAPSGAGSGEGDAARETADLGRRLLAAIEEPVVLGVDGLDEDSRTVRVSASVGLARSPRDAQDVDGLVHAADTAMFSAKRGGGRAFVDVADLAGPAEPPDRLGSPDDDPAVTPPSAEG
ncbi:MAG: CHASE domain-containing protein [Nocardioides sp.]|uniref:CHASE domain-containing protein n=1 Tax=Nocardioides sp. TaxID=35761 RepID=UPI0039E4EED9